MNDNNKIQTVNNTVLKSLSQMMAKLGFNIPIKNNVQTSPIAQMVIVDPNVQTTSPPSRMLDRHDDMITPIVDSNWNIEDDMLITPIPNDINCECNDFSSFNGGDNINNINKSIIF